MDQVSSHNLSQEVSRLEPIIRQAVAVIKKTTYIVTVSVKVDSLGARKKAQDPTSH